MDLDALETSFDLIAPRATELVETFYARLFAAMAEIAGEAWEPRFAAAWEEAFGVVAGVMLEGAAAPVG